MNLQETYSARLIVRKVEGSQVIDKFGELLKAAFEQNGLKDYAFYDSCKVD